MKRAARDAAWVDHHVDRLTGGTRMGFTTGLVLDYPEVVPVHESEEPVAPSVLLAHLLAAAGLHPERRLLVTVDVERAGGYVYLVGQHLWREPRGALRAVCEQASRLAQESGTPVQFRITPAAGVPADAVAARVWEEETWPRLGQLPGSGAPG